MSTSSIYKSISSSFNPTDQNDNLVLYCNQTTNETSDLPARGVIFDNETHECVMPGSRCTREVSVDDIANLDIQYPVSVSRVYEGTILRTFFYKGEWRLSTFRKIDAYTSFWSHSKSFGELFDEAIHELFRLSLSEFGAKMMDVNKQYLFLLRSDEQNRIVCHGSQKPEIYSIGFFSNGVYNSDPIENFPHLFEDSIKSFEELKALSDNMDYMTFSGLLLPHNDEFLKIVKQEYKDLFELRGNVSNLVVRYFQLKETQDHDKLRRFIDLYSFDYKHVQYTLDAIAMYIYQTYKYRYILKQQINVPGHMFFVIRQCHSQYIENSKKVDLNMVHSVLNSQSFGTLYRLYKDFQ